ncbi:MAG: 23S rRNA (uracil(1939)-C(5))-methyltransferase RlmD [Burkholderiaceae bacterium]|jgi:23S rRNA (uracil1939-C5)-methyltransferase|nr:23S rRNA (uracil(1939)-C(5))-methyltransferase RlmD [Burkholderiaceae bacterium]
MPDDDVSIDLAGALDALDEASGPPCRWPDGWLKVEALDIEARGIARRPAADGDSANSGKVVFIEGALPGEVVECIVTRRKNQWEAAIVSDIHLASSQRVPPDCPHFGLHAGACGGCKMQHLAPAAQVAIKQRVLEDNLWRLAKVKPDLMLRPIEGPAWGYRWRARLAVRRVAKKGQVLIGFHERKSWYVTDMRICPILPPRVSGLLLPLRELIENLDARLTCPQIELACGEGVTALALRHLQPLSADDQQKLRDFGARHAVQWWLQPKGPATVHPLQEGGAPLVYALPEFGLTLPFRPTDFTQINPHINRVLVGYALRLLDPRRGERVIDWFCGLGNFTLPIATRAGRVLGIEGSAELVARAKDNYARNRALRDAATAQLPAAQTLADTQFAVRNLFEMGAEQLIADGPADRWLIDPPREGAFALIKALADIQQARIGAPGAPPLPAGHAAWQPPRRIVYVSCNSATLARDAGLLVHQAGYRCAAAGVVNMFPHTAHVESVAVFDWA